MWHNNLRQFAKARGLTEPQARLLRCTAEHLHPKKEGGRNTRDNVVAACRYCNNKRHARPHPLDPFRYRQLVQHRLASGRWLAGLLGWPGRVPERGCGNAASEA